MKIILVIILTLTMGCRANREAEKQKVEFQNAQGEWIRNSTQHKPLDKKIPLLAIKYGIPENAVSEFISTYEIDQSDDIMIKAIMATNIVELRAIETRLANLSPISNTVNRIAERHGIKPETIASLLIDYYSWHESYIGGNEQKADFREVP